MIQKKLMFSAILLCTGLELPLEAKFRDLRTTANEDYLHVPSGIMLPPELSDVKRESSKSYHEDDLNISMQYAPPEKDEFMSIYIFRASSGSVPVWFDRANDAVIARPVLGTASAFLAPTAFSPPGHKSKSGLRSIYNLQGAAYKSTALYFFKHGEWYIKVRATSSKRDAAQIGTWVDASLADIALPKSSTEEPEALLVQDCKTTIAVSEKAKPIQSKGSDSNMSTTLMTGIFGDVSDQNQTKNTLAENSENTTASLSWCHDRKFNVQPGAIYRENEDMQSYLYALSDSGVALSTGLNAFPTELMGGDKKGEEPSYSVTLIAEGKKIHFAPRDTLADPELLWQVMDRESAISASITWGPQKGTVVIEPQ